MKIQNLRILAAVIECRSVTAAAERLHLSQPAVSAGLRALEDDLGHQLFDRRAGAHRIRPNAKALTLYDHAVDILRRCQVAKNSLAEAVEAVPRLRLGVLKTLSTDHVAEAADAIGRTISGHRLRMREGNAADLADWLTKGRIDVAWTTVDGVDGAVRDLWREPYVLCVSPQHRLAQSDRLTARVQDFAGDRLVLRGACELRAGTLRRAGLTLAAAARADRDDLAMHLVARGIGVAIAPRSLATKGVVALAVADLGLVRTIGLRWRQGLSDDLITELARCIMGATGLAPAD